MKSRTRWIGQAVRGKCAVVAALLLAMNLSAGEPWKQKSYKVWNENDVRQILNDSPWAKRIVVESDEAKHAGMETSESGESEGAAGEESGEGGGRGEDVRGRITFVVRWVSSRCMRQAWVRGEVLQKRISESDIDKFLPPPSDDSQLLILGRDMSLFKKLDEATLLAKSFLLVTKSKQTISPNAVNIVRLPDGKGIKGILFHFPKNPLVTSTSTASHNELKFVSRVGATEIRAIFDLQKMVDREGIDL
jgi:hypothetical protein